MASSTESLANVLDKRVPTLSKVRNRLLAALPAFEFEQLRSLLTPVVLKKRQILQEPNRPMASAYFIERGAASLFSRTARDGDIEVGIVGRLGLVGVPIVLGTMHSPHRCMVQVAGDALRIDSADLQRALDRAPWLKGALHKYVQALLVQFSQVSLCNVRHPIHERLPRWLLTIRDRIESDEIPATHDLISQALGVRRSGVSEAVGGLEARGAVRQGKGRIHVTDPIKLEHAACECYRLISLEYSRVLAAADRALH